MWKQTSCEPRWERGGLWAGKGLEGKRGRGRGRGKEMHFKWGKRVELRTPGLWSGQWEPQKVLEQASSMVCDAIWKACLAAAWKTDRRERD